MVVRRALIALIVVTASLAAWLALPGPGQADAPKAGCAGDPTTSDLAEGAGTVAISNRELIVVGSKRDGCMYQRKAADQGLLRHVAVRESVGTAYVEDRAGSDELVVVTPDGTQRLAADGEATQPSWSLDGHLAWAEDMERIEVWSARSEGAVTIEAPARAAAVFSPVFSGRDIAAVAQEPVEGTVSMTEDDTLNNLYLFDAETERWSRSTDFDVSGTKWSAIRTPVATDDGRILFVRVHGDYLETKQPSFELWMVDGERQQKLRSLPQEMYLAGLRNGNLMWNVFSNVCGDWELLVEDAERGLRHLGCGAVLVDPVNLPDEDLLVEDHDHEETQGSEETAAPVEIGVIVGDFSTSRRAARVARRIPGAVVISHRTSPAAVRPGAFAAAVVVSGDVEVALSEVRSLVPVYKDKVFIAPLDKLGG